MMLHGTAVGTKAESEAAFDDARAIATCVMHCVFDIASQGMAPGTLAFGRDMNMSIPFLTDVVTISASWTFFHSACQHEW